jgi:hypothetical protein
VGGADGDSLGRADGVAEGDGDGQSTPVTVTGSLVRVADVSSGSLKAPSAVAVLVTSPLMVPGRV